MQYSEIHLSIDASNQIGSKKTFFLPQFWTSMVYVSTTFVLMKMKDNHMIKFLSMTTLLWEANILVVIFNILPTLQILHDKSNVGGGSRLAKQNAKYETNVRMCSAN